VFALRSIACGRRAHNFHADTGAGDFSAGDASLSFTAAWAVGVTQAGAGL
jgi:hypothetical protein